MKTETNGVTMEAGTVMLQQQAQEPMGQSEAGRGKEGSSPRDLKGEHDPVNSLILDI